MTAAVRRRPVVALVLVATAIVAALVGGRLMGGGSEPSRADAPGEPSLVRYRDPAGFSIAIPRSWRTLASEEPGVRLLATHGRSTSVLVRMTRLPRRVTADRLPAMRTTTDRLVRTSPGVQVLGRPARVTLGGLPGWMYLYLFDDEASGRRGLHAHYFLFSGRTMLALVFQGVPVESFRRSARLFDRIAQSLRVEA